MHVIEQAEALFAKGERSEAFGLLDDALPREPGNAELRVRYAKMALRVATEHDGPNALHALTERLLLAALAIAPQDPEARKTLQLLGSVYVPVRKHEGAWQIIRQGEVHYRAGQNAIAAQHYEEALRVDPQNFTAAKHRGDCAFVENRHPEAAHWYERAIAICPTDPQAYAFLYNARSHLGNPPELALLFKSLAAHPRYWAAWIYLDRAVPRLSRFTVERTVFTQRGANNQVELTRNPHAPPHVNAAWEAYIRAYLGAAANEASPIAQKRAAYLALANAISNAIAAGQPRESYPPRLSIWVDLARSDLHFDAAIYLFDWSADLARDFDAWGAPPTAAERLAFRANALGLCVLHYRLRAF